MSGPAELAPAPAAAPAAADAALGPWQPGVRSQIPTAFLPLATVFRPEHVLTSFAEAQERSAITGLEPSELVAFRPERLAIHELLIQVTSDVSVPDGEEYADLGINFRQITEQLRRQVVEPELPALAAAHAELRARALALAEQELAACLTARPAPPAPAPAGGLLQRLGLARPRPAAPPPEPVEVREQRALAQWRERAAQATDPLIAATFGALARIGTAIAVKHGRLRGRPELLAGIVADLVGNEQGSALIGQHLAPLLQAALPALGYRSLPLQTAPVVMNVKGASAAGKSTMRRYQRHLAAQLGIPWADFALISPDIWRKYLLDYDSLGPAGRYAGSLTGHELQIVDQKLDRAMALKAETVGMSHLVIDRFRFDSFAETPGGEEGSRLLTRFGAVVYMFFMVTPPEATVERAWKRGLQFGRYKAVDDLLAHNVEAYTGMPRLFFTWALRSDKRVHYEFLDNSVPFKERPRTIAFGWNDRMHILDLKGMLDIDRFRKINIAAGGPDQVYPDAASLAPAANTTFLKQCVQRIREVTLADQATGQIYACFIDGRLAWAEPDGLARALADPDSQAGLAALAPAAGRAPAPPPDQDLTLARQTAHTLGDWGQVAAP